MHHKHEAAAAHVPAAANLNLGFYSAARVYSAVNIVRKGAATPVASACTATDERGGTVTRHGSQFDFLLLLTIGLAGKVNTDSEKAGKT